MPCFLVRRYKNEVIVTRADVIHRWGVPELGVKGDAVPGRRNALRITPLCSTVAFGNCYELCGAGHRVIPIVAHVNRMENTDWLLKKYVLRSSEGRNFICRNMAFTFN